MLQNALLSGALITISGFCTCPVENKQEKWTVQEAQDMQAKEEEEEIWSSLVLHRLSLPTAHFSKQLGMGGKSEEVVVAVSSDDDTGGRGGRLVAAPLILFPLVLSMSGSAKAQQEIGLQCFTPDLCQLHCQWNWEPLQPGPSSSLLYWAEDSSISTRTQAWHICEEEESPKDPNSRVCIFQPSNTTYISVLVTVTQRHSQHEVNYFKEPFELYHVVRTTPPRILQANVDRGMLMLEWVPPLEKLTAHITYHLRYEIQNSLNWKDLLVQYSNNTEIHLATGGRYCFQLRTQPDGKRFRGSWSAWSECECVDVPPEAGSTILPVAVALLLCGVLVLGLGCTCFSMYSSVKQKLWPPIPDLHHVLDGFLEDNSKQQQMNAFFCNKTLEDAPLTCLLEVLPEAPQETPSYGPLPNSMPVEQAEWDSQPSSHQHYMVLSPKNSQGNYLENEYFDGKDDGGDTLPMSLDYGSPSEPEIQFCSFKSFSAPLLAAETKGEAGWEAPEEQSISPTHISNQSYLLMD